MIDAGAFWVSQYPTSRSLEDLAQPFQDHVKLFLATLAKEGCSIHIAATRRPEQRAWLMRGAWDVALRGVDAAPAPRPDIQIRWSIPGAKEMVRMYGLAYRPSLTSKHITGEAIDMRIDGWKGSQEALWALGADFGVHKLRSDPPHWSSTGG